eukprot:gene27254-biopygen17780
MPMSLNLLNPRS